MTTIVALSSGRPPAAIAVIRVSGPDAFNAGQALAGRLPAPRRAGLRTLRDAAGAPLDQALVLTFPAPDSATGEDLLELHCHGGRAVVAAVEAALLTLPGLVRAEPGQFTRRGLQNGRIDLAQAHGLADLLEAETEGQRRAALAMAEGRLGREVRGWLDRLVAAGAVVEAALDYADEGDVATADLTQVRADLEVLAAEMATVLAQPPVERWRDGIRVVLAGPVNAGKSSLFNALLAREAAIVTPVAGTTRDIIEASVTRGGIPYVLVDTAGQREATDAAERIGVERGARAAASADILLWLGDDEAPSEALCLHARADKAERADVPAGRFAVSAKDDCSVRTLWERIEQIAAELLPDPADLNMTSQQQAAVRSAAEEVERARAERDELLLAEGLRRARVSLAAILGHDAGEMMLTQLFSRFCVGK